MKKGTFTYGGYTFEPRGQFKNYGFKMGKRKVYHDIICKALHYACWENRFKVADGDEPYDYDEFYKASGDSEAEIFYCKETGELYVPCGGVLMVFDRAASDVEVENRYRKRIAQREEANINRKREQLKHAMIPTEEQHQAIITLKHAIDECRKQGMDFAVDGTDLYVFRTDLLKDITGNMVPMQGQQHIGQGMCPVIDNAWDACEGLYANVKE